MNEKPMKFAVTADDLSFPEPERRNRIACIQQAAEPLLAVVRACDTDGEHVMCSLCRDPYMGHTLTCPVPAALEAMEVDGG